MNIQASCAALLLCTSPATFAADRYVADALTVESLPSGETVTRLVSQNRQTVRQFWVHSVYGAEGTLVVFDGSGTKQAADNNTPARHEPAGIVRPLANAHHTIASVPQ
jgi:hypothetical protein